MLKLNGDRVAHFLSRDLHGYLIAGLTVKVGDNVTDASIRTRIEQLTKNL